jgi:PEP-CTERM motif
MTIRTLRNLAIASVLTATAQANIDIVPIYSGDEYTPEVRNTVEQAIAVFERTITGINAANGYYFPNFEWRIFFQVGNGGLLGDNLGTAGRGGVLGGSATYGSVNIDFPTYTFYADQDVSTVEPFASYDLYGVVVHEIVHTLGFGDTTFLPRTSTQISQIEGVNYFTGTNAVALYGGLIPMEADGEHFAASVVTTNWRGQTQAPIMYAGLGYGVRHELTALDLAVLQDLGYTVDYSALAPIPEPSSFAVLAGLGALGFASIRRRARCI